MDIFLPFWPPFDPWDTPNRDKINAIIKIAEGVTYNRIIHTIEPWFHPSHYAYRRSRGTDAHLTSLTGKMLTCLQEGKFVYLASLDIQGAFDQLPHKIIERALLSAGVERHCAQFIMHWTQEREFKVRITTPKGQYYSRPRKISRG